MERKCSTLILGNCPSRETLTVGLTTADGASFIQSKPTRLKWWQLFLCALVAPHYMKAAPRRLTKRNLAEVVWIQGSVKKRYYGQHQVGFVNYLTATHTETSADCHLPVFHLLSVVR